MAHYALLDENNIVTQVFIGKDETDTSQDWEQYYGNVHNCVCKRTSYNTFANTHCVEGKTPFRKNYAGVGYTYDESKDAFIPPKPLGTDSWILNETTCIWEPPSAMPANSVGLGWNEELQTWT